jgi:regulator of sigma E protease
MAISTIIIFLLVLGVIVFVHELGHFLTAKFFGVRVEEFGLGFPPRIWGRKKGETEYTLNWIPLGGFVKIAGEDGENREDPRSFGSKPVWQRAIVLSAGVLMNLVLAAVLFSVVFASGVPTDVTGVPAGEIPAGSRTSVEITEVAPGSPAEQAGLLAGDKILKAGEISVNEVEDLQNYTKSHADQSITLGLERGSDSLTKEVYVRSGDGNGQGAIGIGLAKVAVIRYGALEAVKAGFTYTGQLTLYIFKYLGGTVQQLLTTGGTTADVSGPVGMVSMTGQAAQLGLVVLLRFIALISVNLAVVNILPLPALDGGRIFFLLIEKIKRSPVSPELEARIHNAGFMLLMLLMVVVTYQDIMKLGVWQKVMSVF